MKVLFIDDEEAVLSGIRRSLHSQHLGWDASFAVGGHAGLDRLRTDSFDVVVTDMRMPEFDGTSILEALIDDHPATVRLVLSGQAEMATAMRTVPLAHQFLAKPCSHVDLRRTIESATELQTSLRRTELLPVVGSIRALPSAPEVIKTLNFEMSRVEVDLDRVIDIVASDPAIAAKILQLANSAFFGLATHVSDIGAAVRYLGLTTVHSLALAVHAFEAVESASGTADIVADVQAHASGVAELAQALVGDSRLSRQAYAAGLLHDIGVLILASLEPGEMRALRASACPEEQAIEVEAELFGANHADVGAYFLSLWGVPVSIVEAVARHHRPRLLLDPLTIADATYLAEAFAHGDPRRTSTPWSLEVVEALPGWVFDLPPLADRCESRSGSADPDAVSEQPEVHP